MARRKDIVAIEFDIRDWDNGFFVRVKIPFSHHNWQSVMAIPGSADIKLIKKHETV